VPLELALSYGTGCRMTASFVAYVDESGDEGFKFLPDEFIVGGKKMPVCTGI
jgi:hypothetical protein